MPRLLRIARRYWIVTLTIAIGLLGIVLALSGAGAAVPWIFSAYALAIAAWQAVGMVRDILRGHWGLDILAVTAIVATVLVGEYVAALLVVLMLTGGEALEDYANRRAKRELDALLTRAPQLAHRMDGDEIVDVRADEVRPGDVLLVRPSEIVPVDATLRSAEAAFDESSITGESVPVEKQVGDAVLSGSVNGQTAVEVVATATAGDSQYQQIVALVAEAAASRAPVVRLADRYAVPFTLFSLALAGVAWWLSGDPVRFAEVLVLATPCPLLIAAPVAFIGGMSRAARNGVIVKGGGVLEQLASARTAVFDKTGTLTYGAPTLVAIRPERGFGEDELLAAVASAEQYSSHVLATSLIAAARERRLPLVRGRVGARGGHERRRGEVDGRDVVVGKFAFVAEHAPDAARTAIAPGELAVYVAIDGRFAGALLASDRLRDDARSMLAASSDRLGVHRTMMLTGDAQATADHIAAELGITRVRADCLPADKVQEVAGDRRAPGDHGRRRRQRRARARGGRRRHRDGREGRHGRERVGRRRDPRRRHLAHGDGGAHRTRHRAHRAAEHLARHHRERRAHDRGRLRSHPGHRRRAAAGGRRPRHDPRGAARDRRPARREGRGSRAARRRGIRSLTAATAPDHNSVTPAPSGVESLHQVCS